MRWDTVDRTLSHSGEDKSERINLGLAVLKCLRRPGATYTYQEIAAFCGCSDDAIRQLEAKALRRLQIHAKTLYREHTR